MTQKSDTAKDMINELSESDFVFNIVESNNGSRFKKEKSTLVGTVDSNVLYYESGGGTVHWDTNGAELLEQKYTKYDNFSQLANRPNVILFHELAHANDHRQGKLSTDVYKDLSVNEWSATHTENKIRSEMQLPLRTYYIHSIDEKGEKYYHEPKLIKKYEKDIISNYHFSRYRQIEKY